jgi:hypothetical protein
MPFPSQFHKATTMKYYNLPFEKIMQDDNEDPDQVAQILNEVLAVVAPSSIAVSYSVHMAPCYRNDDEVEAYKARSFIKCVLPESISSALHAHLETVLKDRSLYSTCG